MAYSPRFCELLTRLKTLEKNFLPAKLKLPSTGQYSQQQEDHARAYVLLVHAEIEAYFEDRVQEVVDEAHNQWKSGTCTKIMERLLRHHLDSQKKPWRPVVKSDDAVNAAISSYSSIVKGINGVKEANLLAMLFPIGFDYHKLDSTWLVTMDSFGSSRGGFTHTTQIKTQQPINPQDEYKTIKKEVLPPIQKLDGKISRLR